jgi:hypothetical protein
MSTNIKIVYADWGLLRERADSAFFEARAAGRETGPHAYMAVTMRGDDCSREHPDAYNVVHSEVTDRFDGYTDHEILAALFEQFNIGDRCGLRIRSMSVGDQVTIGDVTYLCKPVGWDRRPT